MIWTSNLEHILLSKESIFLMTSSKKIILSSWVQFTYSWKIHVKDLSFLFPNIKTEEYQNRIRKSCLDQK